MNVLCFERSFACAPSDASNFSPAAAAAIILRCAGRMRIHTFKVMIVPKIAPTWMYAARPLSTCINPQATAAVIARPNPANAACDFPNGDRTVRIDEPISQVIHKDEENHAAQPRNQRFPAKPVNLLWRYAQRFLFLDS